MDIFDYLIKLLGFLFGERFKMWHTRKAFLKHVNNRLIGHGISGDESSNLALTGYEVPLLQLSDRSRFGEESVDAHETAQTSVSIAQVLDLHDFVVVLGEPGAGKSTLMKYLTYAYSSPPKRGKTGKQGELLPVIVRVREWSNSKQALVQFLEEGHHDLLPKVVQENSILRKYLDKGRLLLLLDGLDEAGTEYEHILDSIQKLCREVAVGNKIVVTTRHTGYHAALARFVHYELNGLEDGQILGFAKRVLGDEGEAKVFFELSQQTVELQDFLENPFMLNLLLQLYKANRKSFPASKVGIIDGSIERLLRLEEADRFDRAKRILWAKALFRNVARLYLEDSDFAGISLEKIDLEIENIAKKEAEHGEIVRQFLKGIVLQKGILWESEHEVFEFIHRSFLEYFCGSFVAYHENPIQLLHSLYFDPDYLEVIRFAMASLKYDKGCSDASKANQIVRDILQSNPRLFELLHQPAIVGGICIGEYGEGIETPMVETVQSTIIGLVPKYRLHDELYVILNLWAGTNMLPPVRKALIDLFESEPDAIRRFVLVEAIGAIGPKDPSAMEFLSTVHLEDRIAFVRDRALELLEAWRIQKLVRADDLIAQLSTEKDFVSSLTMEDSLGYLAAVEPQVVGRLKAMAESSPVSEVRERIFDVFEHVNFHSVEMVDFLLVCLRKEKDEFVRGSIAGSLYEMRSLIIGLTRFLSLLSHWARESDMGTFLCLSRVLDGYSVFRFWPYRRIYRNRVIGQFDEAIPWSFYFRQIRHIDRAITAKVIQHHAGDTAKSNRPHLEYLSRAAVSDPGALRCLECIAQLDGDPTASYLALGHYVEAQRDRPATNAFIRGLTGNGVSPDIKVNGELYLRINNLVHNQNLDRMFALFPDCSLDTQIRIVDACRESDDFSIATDHLFKIWNDDHPAKLYRAIVEMLVAICPEDRLMELEGRIIASLMLGCEEHVLENPDWESSKPGDFFLVNSLLLEHRPTVLYGALQKVCERFEYSEMEGV